MNVAAGHRHDPLDRQRRALAAVAGAPIREGNRVAVLPDGMAALRAMWRAMREAAHEILLEFYIFEDVAIDGESLGDLLIGRRANGVSVAVIYDALGSNATPDAFLARLAAAGVALLPFRGLNPFRRHFSFRVNDRDHRKILVVDNRLAVLGGVNIDRQYLNPPSAGAARGDTRHAFWEDAAARFEGASVGDARALFLDTWRRHGGDPRPAVPDAPDETGEGAPGRETVCVEGSAPREGRPLHLRAVFAALAAARSRVWIASGYFVPMPSEIRAITRAARRGVDVRLVLPGISDVPAVVGAARASYGRLLRAGVRIHEVRHAVLHAKLATADGVLTSVGSSNMDRRSAVLNNEVDAVVLGGATADTVEALMRRWFDEGVEITFEGWRRRSNRDHLVELASLGWRRLM